MPIWTKIRETNGGKVTSIRIFVDEAPIFPHGADAARTAGVLETLERKLKDSIHKALVEIASDPPKRTKRLRRRVILPSEEQVEQNQRLEDE